MPGRHRYRPGHRLLPPERRGKQPRGGQARGKTITHHVFSRHRHGASRRHDRQRGTVKTTGPRLRAAKTGHKQPTKPPDTTRIRGHEWSNDSVPMAKANLRPELMAREATPRLFRFPAEPSNSGTSNLGFKKKKKKRSDNGVARPMYLHPLAANGVPHRHIVVSEASTHLTCRYLASGGIR